MECSSIRVLILDDQPLIRAGLVRLLGEVQDIHVVGCIGSDADIPGRISELQPDSVIIASPLDNLNAEELLEQIKQRGSEVSTLILSPVLDEHHFRKMSQAGVSGFLSTGNPENNIVEAVRVLARGGTWISRKLLRMVTYGSGEQGATAPVLTKREKEVLLLLAQGIDNNQIAATLTITESTVKNHLASIYDKLGVHNRIEAALWAIKQEIA